MTENLHEASLSTEQLSYKIEFQKPPAFTQEKIKRLQKSAKIAIFENFEVLAHVDEPDDLCWVLIGSFLVEVC